MRYSTAADPSAVVASAAAAERLAERRQRDHEAAAEAVAAAGAAAAEPKVEEPPPEAFRALPPQLARFMGGQGFEAPTPVQAKCAPSLSASRPGVSQFCTPLTCLAPSPPADLSAETLLQLAGLMASRNALRLRKEECTVFPSVAPL